MAVRSALSAGRPLPPGRFLVLISVKDLVNPRVIVRLVGLGQLKTHNDLIGTRICDLPACSIVSQPITLPCAPSAPYNETFSGTDKQHFAVKYEIYCSKTKILRLFQISY
jgi:hypothetical protein